MEKSAVLDSGYKENFAGFQATGPDYSAICKVSEDGQANLQRRERCAVHPTGASAKPTI
jgi:hypothetical protein